MKGLYCCVLSLFVTFVGFGQTNGDYRSRQTGNWEQVATWQVWNAGAWQNLEDLGAGVYQNVIPSAASGIITIDGNNVTVTTSVSADQIVLAASNSSKLTVSGTLSLNDGVGDEISMPTGGRTNPRGTLEITGRIVYNQGTSMTNPDPLKFVITSSGTYQHNYEVSAGTIYAATFQAGSKLLISGYTTYEGSGPAGLSQNFYDVIWDCPNHVGNTDYFIDLNGSLVNIANDFIIEDTGDVLLSISDVTPYSMSIGGDLRVSADGNVYFNYQNSAVAEVNVGGNFEWSASGFGGLSDGADLTLNVSGDMIVKSGSTLTVVGGLFATGNATINLLGDFTVESSSTLTKASTASGTANIAFTNESPVVQSAFVSGTITNAVNFIVDPLAILDLGTSILSGSGTFSSSGEVRVGSLNASGAVLGNIPISRTLNTGSTIRYNGQSAQWMGNHHSTADVIIDNTGGVSLAANSTVSGNLILESGNINVGVRTLTLAGNFTPNSNFLNVTSNSSLIINGAGTFGTLATSGSNSINNFTLNRTTNGTVDLASNLTIGGTFTQTIGDLTLNGNTLTINGPYQKTNGSLNVDAGSTFVIGGTGSLPATVTFAGDQALNTLTVNRSGSTLTTNSSLTLSNLNLLSGTFDNTGTITIATGGVVTRTEGSFINNRPTPVTSYDIVYDIASDIVTGSEIPNVSTGIGNLTKSGGALLTLNENVTINGEFTLSNGSFDASNKVLTLKGDFISNASADFEDCTLVFGGTTFIRGDTPPQFNHFTVNSGNVLNLGVEKTIYISGNITNNGSIFGSTSTVIFDGNTILDGGGIMPLKGNFHNIQIAGAGTFQPACAACTVSNPYRIDVSGDFIVATGGTFSEGLSNVRLTGDAEQTLAMDDENFYELQVAGTGVVSLQDPLIVTGNLSIASGATLDTGVGNESITIGDDLSVNGTFIPNIATVIFNGNAGQTISGSSAVNFYNLNISKGTATTFDVSSSVNIINAIDIDQPAGAYSVNFGGTVNAPRVTLLSDQVAGRTGHILAIPDGVTVSGNVRINRFMEPAPSGDEIYRYIASPINGNPVSQLQDDFPVTGTFTGASACPIFKNGARNMYYYNETVAGTSEKGYVGFPTANVSEAMVSGRGYAVQMCDGASVITWDVSGTIRRATSSLPVSLPVTYTDSGLPSHDGMNLVGNPFPAPIDWEATGWVKTNITNTFWIRNNKETNIASYNGDLNTGTNGATQYIALGQAFWVQATGTAPVLSITETVKQDAQPEFFRQAPLSDMLRMMVNHESYTDEIILHFDERADDASNTFGDSRKFTNEFLNLYSFSHDSVRLAINSMKSLSCMQTAGIGLNDVKPGGYSFSFNGFESFSDVKFTLVDRYKAVIQDLTPGAYYAFEVTEDPDSYGSQRFQLIFTRGEGVRKVIAGAAETCEDEGTRVIIENPQIGMSYYILDNAGQTISGSIMARSESPLFIDLNLEPGDHQVTIMANREDCGVMPVAAIPSLLVLAKPSIEHVSKSVVCGSGGASLSVTGSNGAAVYNWYASEDAAEPVTTTSTGEWITPSIEASTKYFVSASNVMGCEGLRVPVEVTVQPSQEISLKIADGSLVTNAQGEIQWFFNGSPMDQNSNELTVAEAGEYSMTSTVNGCSVTAALVVTSEELSETNRIVASPNPTVDFVDIEIFSSAASVKISLLSATGQMLSAFELKKSDSQSYKGRLSLKDSNAGLYILRIAEDSQITYKRIIRK